METRPPLLFSKGVVKKPTDLSHFVGMPATNHAKAYGLYLRKGSIAIGADPDIAIWDPTLIRAIRRADRHVGSHYRPYGGLEVTGWPTTTLVPGQVVVENGVLLAEKGVGAFLKRGKSALVPEWIPFLSMRYGVGRPDTHSAGSMQLLHCWAKMPSN